MPRGPEGFSKPIIDSITEYTKEYSKTREKVLEEIPNKLEGINTARIDQFLKDEGLRPILYLFIEREQVPLLHEISNEPGMILENSNGYHSPLLDVAIAVRDPELETLNGTAYSEGLAIHELAHASNEWLVRVSREGVNESGHKHTDERITRNGFKHRTTNSRSPRGEYLEEAFAQMFCVRYTQKNMSEIARKNFASWLSEESLGKIFPISISK